ncbi:MAG: hypothetical protein V3U44_08295, partial [Alphaproteobacteria bacterium]
MTARRRIRRRPLLPPLFCFAEVGRAGNRGGWRLCAAAVIVLTAAAGDPGLAAETKALPDSSQQITLSFAP